MNLRWSLNVMLFAVMLFAEVRSAIREIHVATTTTSSLLVNR